MYVCFKKIGFSFICVLVFFKNTLQLAFTKILKSTLIFMLNSTLNCGHTFLRYQSLCPLFSENLRYIKFKNLDKIAITTNVYTCISIARKPKLYVAIFHASLHLLLEAKQGQWFS